MSELIVSYDDAGTVTDWRYESDEDYQPADNELAVDDEAYDHRDINAGVYLVDTAADPPGLVEDPDYRPTPTLDELGERIRQKPAERQGDAQEFQQRFETARQDGDLQGQIDIIWEVVGPDQ